MTIMLNIQGTKMKKGGKEVKYSKDKISKVMKNWRHCQSLRTARTDRLWRENHNFQETGNRKSAGNWQQVLSHFKEEEGNIEYRYKGQWNIQSLLPMQIGTNLFYTQMRSLLQFLHMDIFDSNSQSGCRFCVYTHPVPKHYKVSYRNNIETL